MLQAGWILGLEAVERRVISRRCSRARSAENSVGDALEGTGAGARSTHIPMTPNSAMRATSNAALPRFIALSYVGIATAAPLASRVANVAARDGSRVGLAGANCDQMQGGPTEDNLASVVLDTASASCRARLTPPVAGKTR